MLLRAGESILKVHFQNSFMRRKRERIEKPEDKVWKEWFNKLGPQDHKQYMGKLGLTDEDLQELPEIEEQLHSLPENNNTVQVQEARIEKSNAVKGKERTKAGKLGKR